MSPTATHYNQALFNSSVGRKPEPRNGLKIPESTYFAANGAPLSTGSRYAFSSDRAGSTQQDVSTMMSATLMTLPATNDVIVTCNKLAMSSLASETYKECHLFLKRAEQMIE